jgi:hypothetical protein
LFWVFFKFFYGSANGDGIREEKSKPFWAGNFCTIQIKNIILILKNNTKNAFKKEKVM